MSIISVLKRKNKKALFTTPSHTGKFFIFHKFYQWYKSDISEVDAYNPQEALKKAEKKATSIYKTKSTHFLTNGASSGILAAVLTCCQRGDKILIWKNAHQSHANAAKLAGAEIINYKLPYNEEWGIYEKLSNAEELIKKYSPKAIIVTSPSYEGIVSDIKEISSICKKHNVRLIVDEAHGALYPFSDKLPQSAIEYADFTIQSLHKTAGGINPTALLHCNCELNPTEALDMITTTSPSYPMLATIEANINYLNSSKGKKYISNLVSQIEEIKNELQNIEFYGDDSTKLVIKKSGMSGYDLSQKLFDKYNIEDEKTNKKSTMLLCGIGTSKEKLLKLKKALKNLDKSI